MRIIVDLQKAQKRLGRVGRLNANEVSGCATAVYITNIQQRLFRIFAVMPRERLPLSTRRAVAERIRNEILLVYPSVTAFCETLKKAEIGLAESTVRGWLPPERERARSVRRLALEHYVTVRVPDHEGLLAFCDQFRVTADWILFGLEPQYRGGVRRTKVELVADVADMVSASLAQDERVQVSPGMGPWVVDGRAFLRVSIEEEIQRIVDWELRKQVNDRMLSLLPKESEPNSIRLINPHSPLLQHPAETTAPKVAALAARRHAEDLAKMPKLDLKDVRRR